jgi:hypothetical protein
MALGSGGYPGSTGYGYDGNAYQEALFEAMMERGGDFGAEEDELARKREEIAQLRKPGTGKMDWASQADRALRGTMAGKQAADLKAANAALGQERVGVGRAAMNLARGKRAGAIQGQAQRNMALGSGLPAGFDPDEYSMG